MTTKQAIAARCFPIWLGLLALAFLLLPWRDVQAYSANYITPFGGYLMNVDYETCSCGFIIFTIYDTTQQRQYRVVWFYLTQVLEQLGIDWEIEGFPIPIPRVYLAASPYFWTGQRVDVLGNFFPYENATCLMISSSGCSTVSGAGDGYLINLGSSFFPNQ